MIVLMRHAAIEGAKGCCIGRTDVPLSPKGREQAGSLALPLSEIGFARLCVSPAGRAVETLHPLAVRLGMEKAVEIFPGLAEIDMGEWDGLFFKDILARFPEAYRERGEQLGSYRTPGGESFNDVADRALAVLRELAGGAMPTLCVTHAGVIRSVLCRVTGRPMDTLFEFKPGHTECTVLSPSGDRLDLVATGVAPADLRRVIDL